MNVYSIKNIELGGEVVPTVTFTDTELQLYLPYNRDVLSYHISLEELADHLRPFLNNKDNFTELE